MLQPDPMFRTLQRRSKNCMRFDDMPLVHFLHTHNGFTETGDQLGELGVRVETVQN